MKRVALLVFAALMAFGLAALADDEVPTDSDFEVTKHFYFESSGDLEFPEDSEVGEPSATGWFRTNELHITFRTNYNITIGLEQGAFCNGSTELPTRAGGWGTFLSTWLDPWVPVDGCSKGWVATKMFSPGEYSGRFVLEVKRDGYNDPYGTYVSDCFITVYEDL